MSELLTPLIDVAEVLSRGIEGGQAVSDPVRISVAGLEPGLLRRSAAPYDRSAVREAVRRVAEAGRAIVLVAPLADASSTPEAYAEALTELARLALRVDVPLAWEDAAPPGDRHPWILAAPRPHAGGRFTEALGALREAWLPLADATGADAWRSEALLRRLDDAPRRVVFDMLRQAWLGRSQGWPGAPIGKDHALARTQELLGEEQRWLKAFRQYTYDTQRRMVLIPTWQCELRCSYCWIPKQDGRVMPVATMERAIEMLLSTEQEDLLLQFFGGEALIEAENVRHAMTYAHRRAAEEGKQIRFVVSSNGWSLDAEKLAWLSTFPVRLELSLDGDARTQDRYRPSRWVDQKSYDHSIATHRDAILASGLEQFVIMVVHATNVDAMPQNFFHIADLGFRRIQVNYMQGRVWKPEELASFAKGLHTIGRELMRRWAAGEEVEFINMQHKPMAMRLNGEVTVDWDGRIFGGNGFLHETEHKDKFVIGHLDDLTGVDRSWIDATDNSFLLDWSYRPKIIQNNLEVGKIMASFMKWMQRQGFGPSGPVGTLDPAELRAP